MKPKRMSLFTKSQDNKPGTSIKEINELKEVNESPKNLDPVRDEDEKIRVSDGKKKRFSVFKKDKDGDVTYKPESLHGRNPVKEVNCALKEESPKKSNPLQGRNPVEINSAMKEPAPKKSNPLQGRNPVEVNTKFEQPTTSNPTWRASAAPLSGRNPVERQARSASVKDGACDPYGNPIRTSSSPLGGRNPREINNARTTDNAACDPYGNPIPNVACDPYGNPIPTKRGSILEGRNPVDFDVPRDPYGNPIQAAPKAATVITVEDDEDDVTYMGQQGNWQDDPFTRTNSTCRTTAKAQDNRERRSSNTSQRLPSRAAPTGQREKFSLKTYNVPRGCGVPVK